MNFYIAALYLVLLASVWHNVDTSAIAEGNLIYLKSERTATLNPTFINFHRSFDMSVIDTSLKTLDDFMDMYDNFCKQTETNTFYEPDVFPLNKATFREAQFKCSEFRAQLPEIDDETQAIFLKKAMKKYNMSTTFAGLLFRDNQYISMTTADSMNYELTTNCTDCPIRHGIYAADIAEVVKTQGQEYHFHYIITKSGEIAIQPLGHNTSAVCPKLPFLCFAKTHHIPSTLQVLAKHACKRDQTELNRMNKNLREEAALFYNTNSRKKRAIGVLTGIGAGIGGLVGIETLNSLIHNVSPLSLMGRGIASMFGFATAQDLRLTKKQLEAHSQALKNLSVNQQMLISSYQQVRQDIDSLQKAQLRQEHDVAVLFANLDNKLAVRNLQVLLQNTLLKMSQATTSAIQHHTSPFVFGVADLKNLTATFRSQNVPLTDNLNDIYTTLAMVENTFTFIFSAPVLTPKNDLFLYEIRDLPVYNNRVQFRSKIDNRYIAISFKNNEYTVLSDVEYSTCLESFICTAAAPFLSIGPDSPCEILTLKYESAHCELEQFEGPMQSFLTFGNVTYYSIPDVKEIHIVCEDSQASFNQHKNIFGTGKLQIAPGCNIKISKTASIRPSYVISRHNLESDTFFKFLQVPGMPNLYPTTKAPVIVSQDPVRFKDVSSIGDAVNIIFNQDTTLAELIRILIYIMFFISVLGSIYCIYPKFRLWFNGCCFLQKPTKYWRDVKGYIVPDYVSKSRQSDAAGTFIAAEKVDNNIEMVTLNKNPEPEASAPAQTQEEIAMPPALPPHPFNRLSRLYSPLFLNPPKRHH